MPVRMMSVVPLVVALSACPRPAPEPTTDDPATTSQPAQAPDEPAAPAAPDAPADLPADTPDTPTDPAPAPPAAEASITGTSWHLLTLDGEPPPEGVDPWFQVDATGALTGYAGCNGMFGNDVTVDSDRIDFGSLGTTRRACPALPFEQSFVSALADVTSWRREGAILILATDDTERARFEAR